MFVKIKFTGANSTKFMFIWVIINIMVYGVYIFQSLIPYTKDFLDYMSICINSGQWDIYKLVIPIGYIVLYYVIVQVILLICGYILYKNFINN